jgi:hypothetical protein
LNDCPDILPRDKHLRDSFTPAESMLFGLAIVIATVSFWLADPRSIWLLGTLMILGALTPFVLKAHEHHHPFFIDLLWPKFWLYSAPVWIVLLQHLVGLSQSPLSIIQSGEQIYHTLEPVQVWRPTSTADGSTWITIFGYCGIFLISTLLFIIPKSRSFFERMLPWLCLSAILVCIYGYIQIGFGIKQPPLTKGSGASDFFAFFPYDGHWAAFAILWCAVCTAMALLSTRYDDSSIFIHSIGPWYLTGAMLLGASGFFLQAVVPSAILILSVSVMLFTVTANFLKESKDPHRFSIAFSSGFFACLFFAAAIFRFNRDGSLLTQSGPLRKAAVDMFQANPIFGWGLDSYEKLLPFFASDLMLGHRAERAVSDVLQLLVEFGLLGLAATLAFLTIFSVRYLRIQHDIRLTKQMLLGCAAVLILSIFDSPFMSPAVFYSFFVIFFSAMRWADLSRNKADEVDAQKPQLVTPESMRNVPFFTKPYHEKEK